MTDSHRWYALSGGVLECIIEDVYGYFDIDREGLLGVGGTVKQCGYRSGYFQDAKRNPPSIST